VSFPLLKEDIVSIEELKDGTSNKTYLLNGHYVCRKIEDSDLPFFSPINEAKILKAVEGKEIAPKQIAYDEKNGDKVEEYIKDARAFNGSKEDLKLFAGLLRKLHSLSSKGIAPFNTKERYLFYKKKSQEDLGEGDLYKEIAHLLGGKQVICHNDLWSGNTLIKEGRAYLIDFEFSATNSPIFDLASLLSENKIEDEDLIKFFLREYFEKEDVSQEYKDVKHLMKFEDALWFYWAKCRYLDTGKESFLAIMKDKQEAYLK
jgi:thiamine kinase-like enzyme